MDPRLLERLIEHARRRRDEAAGVAAQAERAARQAGRTMETLQAYRRDYEAKAPTVRRAAFDPGLLPRHEAFVGRLDIAVADQSRQLERAREEADAQRGHLLEAERRAKAFETLQTRRRAALARRAQRREQFDTDELAARLVLKARSQEDPPA